MIKQTVVEYYSQDGCIQHAISEHLKANPNQTIKHMGLTQYNYQGKYNELVYGSYALVVYEEVESNGTRSSI